MKKIRSNKYNLLNYFVYPEERLSKSYVKYAKKFLENLGKTKNIIGKTYNRYKVPLHGSIRIMPECALLTYFYLLFLSFSIT
jgi:hypothetical protein